MHIKDKLNQKGVAAITTISVLTIVLVAVSIAIARLNLTNFIELENLRHTRESYYLSESGIEDTILQFREDITYSGNESGEETPIGIYYSTVDKTGDDYTFTSWGQRADTERRVHSDITVTYELAPVTTKATYMADFFWIRGEGARIRGNVWTNDDFDVVEHGVIEGNLTAAGKGSLAVNWVWDGVMGGDPELEGGEVLDNPDTPESEGNIVAADAVKVSGPSAYVEGNVTSDSYVWEIFGGTIDGTITEYAELEWDLIPVPQFDFDEYEQQAITEGTYFSNANSFENYVDSLDDGSTRTLPDDIYYVKNGTVKIEAGNPVYFDGLLVVEDSLYIYCEWYQNAQDGEPAIVTGKYAKIENKFNFGSWNYEPAGPVRINGIVFAEKDIDLFRTFGDEDIIIQGAVWAGDDVFIGTHTYVKYDINPVEVVGFGFVSGISDIEQNYWREVL